MMDPLVIGQNADLDHLRRIWEAAYVVLICLTDVMKTPYSRPVCKVDSVVEEVVLDVDAEHPAVRSPVYG